MMTLKILTALCRSKQSNGQHVYVIETLPNIAVVTTYSQVKINKNKTQQLYHIIIITVQHCI